MKYPYIKFYFRDWQANSELQTCSIQARGVWIEMMCIMAQSERFGYLERNGQPIDIESISRLIRVDKATLNPIVAELEHAGVFSRCPVSGAIFSRRMVKDSEQAARFSEFGKKGGNPSLKNLSKEIPITIPIPIPTEGLTLGVIPTLNPKKNKVVCDLEFNEFWKLYPRKVAKPNAINAYRKAITRTTHNAIIDGLKRHVVSFGWKNDGGKFIPHAATWLNRDGWNDEVLKDTHTLPNTRIDANPANPALDW